jgi:hypothetical protein
VSGWSNEVAWTNPPARLRDSLLGVLGAPASRRLGPFPRDITVPRIAPRARSRDSPPLRPGRGRGWRPVLPRALKARTQSPHLLASGSG